MPNPFIHIELNSTEPAKARAFYNALFDWELKDMPLPGAPAGSDAVYTAINVGGGTGGGIRPQLVPGARSSWLAYALVKDIRGATDKARELGANIIEDVTEVPGMGFISIIQDPTGAMLGLWQYTNP
jgi:hypothetical protein